MADSEEIPRARAEGNLAGSERLMQRGDLLREALGDHDRWDVREPGRHVPAELADYVRELERIALGRDPSASARDRLSALKELVKLDAAAASAAGTVIVNVNPMAHAMPKIESEDGPNLAGHNNSCG